MVIRNTLRIRTYKKGELIAREGKISTSFYYNLQGFVRLYYTTLSGDKTAYFYSPGQFISDYESFVRQTPSKLNLQATERSTLVDISQESAAKLLQYSPKFEAIARIAMEDELITHQNMIASLLTCNAEERYYQLIEKTPEIMQKVPQHYIASYIGVKPESLSRIKKRHFERNS